MAEVTGQVDTPQPAHAIFQENLNPADAVGLLAKAMEGEESPKPRNDKGQFAKQEAPKEEPQGEPQAEAPEEPKEEAQPEVQETEAQPEEPRKLKLKYKGEEKEYLEPEVIELAQKGYDYTQKMQQLAKERDEVQSKLKADSEKALKQYEQQLEVHKKALSQISGVKSMAEIEALSRTDPVAAQQEFLRALSVNQAIAAVEAEQAKIQQQRSSEAQETYTKQARESVEKLQDRIPGWNNELYGKILKNAVDHYGFQQQEVNAITDHRAIEVLNDARQWREYQAAKPKTVDKRVASVPKVQKPGTSEKPNPNADRLKASMAKVKETGSRDAAVDYFRTILEKDLNASF